MPFCQNKCPYCDFYSAVRPKEDTEKYVEAVKWRIKAFSQLFPYEVNTVYFGGGTPSLLGGAALSEILECVKDNFSVCENSEITAEVNPGTVDGAFFKEIVRGGFNRLSIGLQSANTDELTLLGRHHGKEQAANAVKLARAAGIKNISLDLMIGLPNQTEDKLKSSIDFCGSLGVEHISSYILKVEENTVFGRKKLVLPDDDTVSNLYLYMANYLEEKGYGQYEISNFSKAEFEGKHNLKYWHCQEYLGIGPSAHSYIDGKRYYFDRSFNDFTAHKPWTFDCDGGDFEEYAMLVLRLKEGLISCRVKEIYGDKPFLNAYEKAKKLPKSLIECNEDRISLTKEGFLLSNEIIARIIL